MNSKLKPALIGGAVAGIVASLPQLNSYCCVWMIAGGVLAAHLYFKGQEPGETKQIGAGASLGLIMGLLAAVIGTVVKAILVSAGIGIEGSEAELVESLVQVEQRFGKEAAEMAAEIVRQMNGMEGVTTLWVALWLAISLVTYSIVGIIGGMVGAAIFAKKQETA